ncbi:hypothetical protein GCM10020255_000830 [Rhodococcus baikonurensis]
MTEAPTTGTGKTVSVGAAAAGWAPTSSATTIPATIDARRKPWCDLIAYPGLWDGVPPSAQLTDSATVDAATEVAGDSELPTHDLDPPDRRSATFGVPRSPLRSVCESIDLFSFLASDSRRRGPARNRRRRKRRRWLREVFASRTLPSKFFSAQGGTPAPHAGAILLCQKAKDLTGTRPGHFHDKGILNQVVKRPKGEE